MKLIYLTIVLIVAIIFAVSDVDAFKKHKHKGYHHVYHHHYYHGGYHHGHGYRYRREVIDIKPEESKGPLLDKLMVSRKADDSSKTEEMTGRVPEEKTNGDALVKDTVKDATQKGAAKTTAKADDRVQNVASFAL